MLSSSWITLDAAEQMRNDIHRNSVDRFIPCDEEFDFDFMAFFHESYLRINSSQQMDLIWNRCG